MMSRRLSSSHVIEGLARIEEAPSGTWSSASSAAFDVEPSTSTVVGVSSLSRTGSHAPPPPSESFVSVPRAAWNNVLTMVQGQLAGDPTPWVADDDLWGEHEREAFTMVVHGPGGGVYKAWASSEREARALVAKLGKLQAELRRSVEMVEERHSAAEERAGGGATRIKKALTLRLPTRRAGARSPSPSPT